MEQKKITILLLIVLTVTGINGQMKCNGLEGLCDLRIDQVTFPGAHNAGSTSGSFDCGWRNQGSLIWRQFEKGVRYFDIDTCWHDGQVKNCHCNSFFGCEYGDNLRDALIWLDTQMKLYIPIFDIENRYEVVILHFNRDADISGEAAKQKIGEGLEQLLTELWDPNGNAENKMNTYYKNNNNQWPTLRQAIESNQRVFVFMDNGPAKYINPEPDWLVQSNGLIASTWSTIFIWSTDVDADCTEIVSVARDKCDTSRSFVELAAFGTFGRCIEKMAKLCSKDEAIGAAMDECYSKREQYDKTVNILLVDYAVDTIGYETLSVVNRAKTMNEKNIQKFNP